MLLNDKMPPNLCRKLRSNYPLTTKNARKITLEYRGNVMKNSEIHCVPRCFLCIKSV